ncbi:MAG: phosphoglycerate dehydrogenase [Chloroflexi bacterium]|nr:phosphoglycerate dehydrogenase [Chloroflexota bacterium]
MKVLIADPIAAEGIELLRQHAEVHVRTGLGSEALLGIIGDYDALIVRSETRVDAPVLAAGKKLIVVARAGVGIDNIDVDEATRRGIAVVNAPAGNTVAAAEHTMALMLALARHVPHADARLRSGHWERTSFTGVELRNKTLGIMGLGNVGAEVARRARAFQMRLIGYDPFVSVDYARNLGVDTVPLERLLAEADFITVHVPLSAATRGLIGDKELGQVKPTVRLVNCARGGIVDEVALLRALDEGRVAGAAVDVFAREPATDNPLFKSDKVVVTPHLAASTTEAQTSVATIAAEQVIDLLQGRPARYAVNLPQIPAETLAVVGPFLNVAKIVGRLATQLLEGQLGDITIKYEGEIGCHDTAAVTAAVIGGLLESTSEERVNLVNATIIAARRGLKILEQKSAICQSHSSLVTVQVAASAGTTEIAGTWLRGEPHIAKVNQYWIDFVPGGGYFLFSDHRDRPGLIGAVGMVTGSADINISSMLVSRLRTRGPALMVLGLDEPLSQEQIQKILSIPDVYTARLVRL